jgi:hypothetical protein
MMQGEPDAIILEAPFDQLRDELKDGRVCSAKFSQPQGPNPQNHH